jgi:hypothetical protein
MSVSSIFGFLPPDVAAQIPTVAPSAEPSERDGNGNGEPDFVAALSRLVHDDRAADADEVTRAMARDDDPYTRCVWRNACLNQTVRDLSPSAFAFCAARPRQFFLAVLCFESRGVVGAALDVQRHASWEAFARARPLERRAAVLAAREFVRRWARAQRQPELLDDPRPPNVVAELLTCTAFTAKQNHGAGRARSFARFLGLHAQLAARAALRRAAAELRLPLSQIPPPRLAAAVLLVASMTPPAESPLPLPPRLVPGRLHDALRLLAADPATLLLHLPDTVPSLPRERDFAQGVLGRRDAPALRQLAALHLFPNSWPDVWRFFDWPRSRAVRRALGDARWKQPLTQGDALCILAHVLLPR